MDFVRQLNVEYRWFPTGQRGNYTETWMMEIPKADLPELTEVADKTIIKAINNSATSGYFRKAVGSTYYTCEWDLNRNQYTSL